MLIAHIQLIPDFALYVLVAQVLVHGCSPEERFQDDRDLHFDMCSMGCKHVLDIGGYQYRCVLRLGFVVYAWVGARVRRGEEVILMYGEQWTMP